MTLKTKNRLIFIQIFISMALILTSISTMLLSYFSGNLSEPQSLPFLRLQNYFLFRYRFFCPYLSVLVLLLYTFVTLIIMNIEFEKTQSSEIIYLTVFFIGCFAESARFLYPLLDLWNSTELTSIAISRLILMGRSTCTISLLFASLYSKTEYRQYVERNILLIFVISLIFSLLYPLNTGKVLPEGRFEWGYSKILVSAQRSILILAFVTQTIISFSEKANLSLAFGLLFIASGHCFLCYANNIFNLVIGTIFILLGTWIYIRRLHTIYLWNN